MLGRRSGDTVDGSLAPYLRFIVAVDWAIAAQQRGHDGVPATGGRQLQARQALGCGGLTRDVLHVGAGLQQRLGRKAFLGS